MLEQAAQLRLRLASMRDWTCGRSGLLQLGVDGLARVEEHLVGRLAFEGVMRHHFVMLHNVKRDPLTNRFERIKSLLKQTVVFR